MKYFIVLILLTGSSIVVKGQTITSITMPPKVIVDSNGFLIYQPSQTNSIIRKAKSWREEELEKVSVDIIELYDQYLKQPKDSISVYAGCPDGMLGCLVHHGYKKQAVEPSFEKFIEYLRKK